MSDRLIVALGATLLLLVLLGTATIGVQPGVYVAGGGLALAGLAVGRRRRQRA